MGKSLIGTPTRTPPFKDEWIPLGTPLGIPF